MTPVAAPQAELHPLEQIPMDQHRFSLRQKVRSLFVVAFIIFALLNIYCSFCNPFHFDPYKYSYKGWAWWTMNDLKGTDSVHNVAVLGSSLMVSAVAGCDANYLNRPLDLTKYHHVSYLDKQLTKSFGGKFNTFNLSAPGQMPSDAYLSLRAMAATANRPEVVIYGVAPRDFVDSTLSGPNDTEPFKYLTRFVNIDDVATHEFRSPWAKLDWCMQRLVFLYGYSLDFRLALADESNVLASQYLPAPPSKHPFTWWDRVKILPTYIPAEIHPEAVISSPLTAAKIEFKDNTQEYLQRYKSPDKDTFNTQIYFLRKLSEFCHRERIQLVLVNMPIMEVNTKMLSTANYHNYLDSMNKFAWNNDVVYYDLCNFTQYQKLDYHDTVHLNAFGGKKFFDNLMTVLLSDPRANNSLALAGIQLERNTALAEKLKTPLKPRMF